ncbi:MAG: ABC transporter ATP-binding protein [Hyphomicrobiaceae bacterium]
MAEGPFGAWLQVTGAAPRSKVVTVVVVMLLTSLTEGIGIIMLVPLLEAMQGRSSLLSRSIDGAFAQVGLTGSIVGMLVVFVGLVGLRAGLLHLQLIGTVSLMHSTMDALRQRCFSGLMHAEWRWLALHRPSDHASVILNDIARVGLGLNQALSAVATAVSTLVYIMVAFALSWRTALFAALGGALVLLAFTGLRRRALLLGQQLGDANRALQGHVQEKLHGVRQIKIVGGEASSISSFAEMLTTLRRQQLSFVSDSSIGRSLLQVAGAAALAMVLYFGYAIWDQSLATLLPLVLVFARLVPMLGGLQHAWHHWLHALPALQSTNHLIEESRRAAEPSVPPVAGPAISLHSAIELRGVTVRYAGRDRPALDGLSLDLPAGTTTLVVGASGAGKSTLGDLLMGLIEPDLGMLQVDGVPVTGDVRRRWRGAVGYVQQDPFIFHDTIRNNLLWPRFAASEADLREALAKAGGEFVFALPDGIDTPIGDGGARLSGGERQRIAIARALLGKPALLILDEVTSALDRENQAVVKRSIAGLRGRTTMLLISHNDFMFDLADRAFRLEAGRCSSEPVPSRI